MISYNKFKELFLKIDSSRNCEIELYFNDRENTYMICKGKDSVLFCRCSSLNKGYSDYINFNDLDELYNTKTIDEVLLRDEWSNITDIILDASFSVVDDKEELFKQYGVKL